MFYFLLFGRGRGPRPNSKKKHSKKAQTAKKRKRHRPFRACFFCSVWAGGRVHFFAVWAGVMFFFLLFGRGACLFLLFGRGARFVFFCCLGGGRVFFFAVWAGDGSSLTYRSAWLVFKRPNNKEDQTATKNTGSGVSLSIQRDSHAGRLSLHTYHKYTFIVPADIRLNHETAPATDSNCQPHKFLNPELKTFCGIHGSRAPTTFSVLVDVPAGFGV